MGQKHTLSSQATGRMRPGQKPGATLGFDDPASLEPTAPRALDLYHPDQAERYMGHIPGFEWLPGLHRYWPSSKRKP